MHVSFYDKATLVALKYFKIQIYNCNGFSALQINIEFL